MKISLEKKNDNNTECNVGIECWFSVEDKEILEDDNYVNDDVGEDYTKEAIGLSPKSQDNEKCSQHTNLEAIVVKVLNDISDNKVDCNIDIEQDIVKAQVTMPLDQSRTRNKDKEMVDLKIVDIAQASYSNSLQFDNQILNKIQSIKMEMKDSKNEIGDEKNIDLSSLVKEMENNIKNLSERIQKNC